MTRIGRRSRGAMVASRKMRIFPYGRALVVLFAAYSPVFVLWTILWIMGARAQWSKIAAALGSTSGGIVSR